MLNLKPETRGFLRTLLLLARASNLPTVWSNCLAGWVLGGGGDPLACLVLCLGASFLYIGGMYLNDAFDEEFDRMHRKERPIPSGAIGVSEVWGYGLGWLGAGAILLFGFGKVTVFLTLLLILFIILYDAIHKMIDFSPVIMAACRFFLFLVAASTGVKGVTGLALWCSIALALYIIGLSYVAKSESNRGPLRYWPCCCLAAPLLLAFLVNDEPGGRKGVVLSLIFFGWVIRCLRSTFWTSERNIGRTVSGLLAGIVLVDLLALFGGSPLVGLLLVLFFGCALLFQRFIPAT